MPLRGQCHSDLVKDETPYFKSLAELDAWFTQPHDKLSGVLPYQPRPHADGLSESRGKLLVCHDYRGGYIESPSGLCYTFNFWQLCDTFVYFSHNRVAVPPSGWTNAAHKQGTRMLGTLIFEHAEAEPDVLQLIVGSPDFKTTNKIIPISKHYAVLLAELAHQRGFDGYLLNVEVPLRFGVNQARALASWILSLREELKARVGPHAQAMWYDSVIYNGKIKYQNRVNAFNLPFFLASDTFFTNYWWNPETQKSMTEYFKSLVPSTSATSSIPTKTLESIYTGADVWPGRGAYGDGGWCTYRALTHTSPLGLSAAIFAPGWTWEGVTKDPEQNWNTWWENDRKFWLGPLKPGEIIPVPPAPEGPFRPVTTFFSDLPPPYPSEFSFYTHFSPGVGYSWFVEGKKVLETTKGWTDIDKQTSIGNLAWPWPTPSLDFPLEEDVPTATSALDMTDGYNGGNTLKLTLTCAESKSEVAVKTIWLPFQSLIIPNRVPFEACVVYKVTVGNDVDVDFRLNAKSLTDERGDGAVFSLCQPNGWTQQTLKLTQNWIAPTLIAIGFFITIRPKNPSSKTTFSISLGQLAIYPTPSLQSVSVGAPSVAAANFVPTSDTFEGVLTWDTISTFSPINVVVEDPESTTPAWLLEDTPAHRFPTFVYFNVYAAVLVTSGACPEPADAAFIGTTGLDGRANRFYVDLACLPTDWNAPAGIRYYIQGVTDRGEVLPWDKCATVDYYKPQ